jgi:hypothetical protein
VPFSFFPIDFEIKNFASLSIHHPSRFWRPSIDQFVIECQNFFFRSSANVKIEFREKSLTTTLSDAVAVIVPNGQTQKRPIDSFMIINHSSLLSTAHHSSAIKVFFLTLLLFTFEHYGN